MNPLSKLIRVVAILAFGAWIPAASAQAVYENFTFTTLAGPPEAGSGWHDGPGGAARFYQPAGAAIDAEGNVYVADSGNQIIRKITPAGVVTTLAGLAGTSGSADGAGSAARFHSPSGTAVDASGNVFVTDTINQTIRKITPAGVVSTLAGLAGVVGSANGAGSAARFNYPFGIALDGGGNLYIADASNFTIRKLTPAGVVSTLAGLAGASGSANGTGGAARFNYPEGVAVDTASNVYVADTANHTIRLITPAGVVTKLAGTAGVSGSANGTAGAASFYDPCGVVVDASKNVFVADTYNDEIREISSAGTVTTLAGSAGAPGGADGTGNAAGFSSPYGIALDAGGNLYIADTGNETMRKIASGAAVTTLAGVAIKPGSADGTGRAATFNSPRGVAVGADGNRYVADTHNHAIRKITPDGVVSTLAGLAGVSGTVDGTNSVARFNNPEDVAVDTGGNVYVADTLNHAIRKITPDGVVTTLAGLAGTSGSANGTNSTARFYEPYGVAVDTNGTVYVADTYNDTIRKITPDGVTSTLAGLAGASGSTNGTGGAARFNYPCGVAVDADGTLFIADTGNHILRKIMPGGAVTTVAGKAGASGGADGTGIAATFDYPCGVAVDGNGNLYVADTENYAIRAITPAGVVTTLGGLAGSLGATDETGGAARFYEPYGVAVDGNGNVYVADTDNDVIRQGWPALPDLPVVDAPVAITGVVRHLDVTNLTTTSWSWSLIRQPASSSAQLSSTTIQNPTITPDVPDLFVLRFEGTNDAGRVAIGTVSIVVDVTPPTLKIVSPTQGQQWSNAVFAVSGTASDNVAVSKVWWQVNGGDWVAAMGTTNWTASVALAPGTNVIRAYAADTSGNASTTNQVSLIYAAGAQLVVQITGNGTVTPNYNGQTLQIFKTYSMKAAPGAGFAFTNWTGGAPTNQPTVSFIMQSNLTLIANFVDTQKPTVTITSPMANQHGSNAAFTVKGTATDNGLVAGVFYQLNANDWTAATGTTNWTASVALTPGTNIVRAYSMDAGGNLSPTNSVTFVYVPVVPFIQTANQSGSGFTLVWSAIPGRSYQVQYKTDLTQTNWGNLGGSMTATSYNATASDGAASAASQKFYRVVLLP